MKQLWQLYAAKEKTNMLNDKNLKKTKKVSDRDRGKTVQTEVAVGVCFPSRPWFGRFEKLDSFPQYQQVAKPAYLLIHPNVS